MDSKSRREDILVRLIESLTPIKGSDFAKLYNVTRQIIVKDIAILRAKGNKIIATPDGYIITSEDNRVRTILAVCHESNRIEEELEIIIKYGGIIEDVIVEHPLYGEIKGILMIKNLNDLNNFIKRYENNKAKPLSVLTNGVHIHTISADNEENMELIKRELKERGFIIS